MSLRTRLGWVLIAVMVGPVLAAWWVVAELGPRTGDRAAQTELARADAAVVATLGQQCRLLAMTAQAVAAELGGDVGVDAVLARQTVSSVAARLPEVAVVVVADGDPVARTGSVGTGSDVASPNAALIEGVAPERLVGASCAAPPPTISPVLVQSAPVLDQAGAEAARVAAYQVLDESGLLRLRAGLGLSGDGVRSDPEGLDGLDVGLLDDSGALVAGTGAIARRDRAVDAVLDAARTAPTGRVAGVRFQLDGSGGAPPPGLGYRVLVLQRDGATGPGAVTVVLVVLGVLALFGVLAVLARRMTQPLAELTATARRLGDGDLAARSRITGRDEIGVLGEAFDTMAARLQQTVADLERSRDALADSFGSVGQALANTHNLDALVRTVAEAARRGGEAAVGAVLLGDGTGLAERVSVVPDGVDAGWASAVLDRAGDLAKRCAGSGRAVTRDLAPLAGAAVAVPMAREDQVLGVLVVVRERHAAALEEPTTAALRALGAQAAVAVANVLEHQDAQRMSVTDPLTGVANVRNLMGTLVREVERAHRFGRTLSVLMLDLDHFKRVNDTLGHAFGDAVLREFARRLTGCLREVDLVARRGGEEFAVVLPETGEDGAVAVVRRVLRRVRAEPFRGDGLGVGQDQDTRIAVTVSVGIATYPVHGATAAELLHAADVALYESKRTGRDRWTLAGAPERPPAAPPSIAPPRRPVAGT